MIPIKLVCGCGQPYAFDFEPSSGGLACAVQCPACGADGSEAANQEIRRQASAIPRAPRPSHASPPLAACAPSTKRRLPLWIGGSLGLLALVVLAGLFFHRTSEKQQVSKAPAPIPRPSLPNTLE